MVINMSGLSIAECNVYGVEKLVEVGKDSTDPLTRYLAERCEVTFEQEDDFCTALSELDELKEIICSLSEKHSENVKDIAKTRLIKDRQSIAEDAEGEFKETIASALEKFESAYKVIENFLIDKQQ